MNLEKLYSQFCKENSFEPDISQQKLVSRLSSYQQIIELSGDKKPKILKKISVAINNKNNDLRKGIYIWGDVGRGKSMILDFFYDNLKVNSKLSIHFHEFMLDFHKKLDALRSDVSNEDKKDHVTQLAADIGKKVIVICLDELQINNIADAMIVSRLFRSLLTKGTYLFFTSNREPEELFKDGLQRERFLPFIDLIKSDLEVFNLNNFCDYRLMKLYNLEQSYFYPLNEKNDQKLTGVVTEITGRSNLENREIFIDVNHSIMVHKCYGNVAEFTFNELCEVPLGAVDYIALCKNFNTFVIRNIPILNADKHNEALRFITLIDCMYEHHTKLLCTAADKPEKLYELGRNQFEFKRTASRLNEMQTSEYFSRLESIAAA
jgi:cell division protein ZapE